MAEKRTIARPYAKALFELALGQKRLDAWSKGLEIAALVASDERVRKLLTSPHVTTDQLAELVIGVCGGALDAEGRNFIRLLALNRRLGLLPEIAALFERLKSESENTVDVTVASAAPLNAKQQSNYAAALRRRLQREVRLHCVVDPALLGGAILRADDLVIDGSLRGRLDRLATQLLD